jgi:hypothetical protein
MFEPWGDSYVGHDTSKLGTHDIEKFARHIVPAAIPRGLLAPQHFIMAMTEFIKEIIMKYPNLGKQTRSVSDILLAFLLVVKHAVYMLDIQIF